MVITQHRAKRKQTGGRYIAARGKRKQEVGRKPALTKVAERKAKSIRVKGGKSKLSLLSEKTANLYDPKSKSYSKAEIKAVLENPADRHFVRRNIITKGAVIETDKGKAKVTSRPGQDGVINAVLV